MKDSGSTLAPSAEVDPSDLARTDRRRRLGASIRSLRRDRDLSTALLAKRSGVSASMISQAERGLTAPSLDVLWAIARALDVPIGTFFQEMTPNPEHPFVEPGGRHAPVVVRADERKRLGLTNSLTYELLSPDLQHQIEFVWIELGPGEEGPIEPYVHAGEEQMVVISGQLRMSIDGQDYLLESGDAITLDSSLPHRASNPSDSPTIVVAAITPPSF